ncbi:MAG: dihydrodipicolinate synthase family protein [Rhodobacterales bacterium]|nr:dihydrodipicolinate synthase family protein [Rhodobacterales bacterium]
MIKGIYAAVLTPIDGEGAPHTRRLIDHGRWLLATGCDGLSVLGTTGEATAFCEAHRKALLEDLVGADIAPSALMPGTGCCAIDDTVSLSRHALSLGVTDVLVLPPFYYKDVDTEGLYRYFAQVIEGVGDDRLRLYLYNFPRMTGLNLGPDLVARLRAAFPDQMAGMKDSAGDLDALVAMARAFPGFQVLTGWDDLILPSLRDGGAGAITAVCNVGQGLAHQLMEAFQAGDDGAAEQAHMRLAALQTAITAHPLTAALKEILAVHGGDMAWRRVRPPLVELDPDAAERLHRDLKALDFAPPPLQALAFDG